MIQVTVVRNSDRLVKEIRMKGHAGYGREGQDIVCSAVSALVFTACNSIEAFTGDEFESQAEEASGSFTFGFKGKISQESKLLMDSLVLGLTDIMDSYGKQYIIIRFEEV